ncbi:MAG: cytochrome P450 [Acidimicrobiales bacterium]
MSRLDFAADTEIDLNDLDGFWSQPEEAIAASFAWLRHHDPVRYFEEPRYRTIPTRPGYWAVTRYADVVHVSKHPELFQSGRGIGIPDRPPEFDEQFSSMIAMDDPRHARLRRVVAGGFTPRMLARLEDSVQAVAAEIVDDVGPTGGCDFVTEIAAALPLRIVCDLMGIPDSLYEHVFDQTNIILGAGDPEFVPPGVSRSEAVVAAGEALNEVMDDLATVRAEHPTDDLTSVLLQAEVDGERLTHGELGSFFNLLVAAGNETTRNAISWGLVHLTQHPDQRRMWQDDIEGRAPTAVDEIVRYASPVIHFRRTVTTDTILGGQPLSAGDKVVMFYNSANRDEAAFDEPERFDVTRQPNHHVGFGGPGPHFCLGAHLARREITVMFRELFRRIGDIEATDEPERLRSNFIHGIKHLPCTFTPTA